MVVSPIEKLAIDYNAIGAEQNRCGHPEGTQQFMQIKKAWCRLIDQY
tara:strand:- start:2518 stop:2658 length:141 start_codon:yes stop_codon:yes gene_type:complete